MDFCYKHIKKFDSYLYRIFYYDCEPLTDLRPQNPISGKTVVLDKEPEAIFRKDFFEDLRKRRKVALRLGRLKHNRNWLIRPNKTKQLLHGKIEVKDLNERDVYYEMRQKRVDIKIGLDIATLAYKKLVSQIILISGDSDFVPVSKFARREGIDFILDPMWNHVDPHLFETY